MSRHDLDPDPLHELDRAGRDADEAWEPELAPGPDQEATPREGLHERDVVHAHVDEEEVRLRGNRPRARLGEDLGEPGPTDGVRLPPLVDEVEAPEARAPGRQGCAAKRITAAVAGSLSARSSITSAIASRS